MKTLKSLETGLERLRNKHTKQAENGKWIEMQTTRSKIISLLNSIAGFLPVTKPQSVIERKYYELLYAVENKYEGESRHDTALRFIQNYQRDQHIFEEREAKRDKWDEQGERENDLRQESIISDESERQGAE